MSRLDKFEEILKSYPDSNRWIHYYDFVECELKDTFEPNKILPMIHLKGIFTYRTDDSALVATCDAKFKRPLPKDGEFSEDDEHIGILTNFVTIANWVITLAHRSNPDALEACVVFRTGEAYCKDKLRQYLPRLEKLKEEFRPEISEYCKNDFLWRFGRLLENIKENNENDKGPNNPDNTHHFGAAS